MADYKLSELNSIDTIRSDDLLHIRVKKRPEMLGDEDRRMTYQDFLASFKLERFVQIAGSTMTGDLGIVKLLYGGKAVFDPTGSSEITMGDVLKAFKINANGLKLTIADASRSATVYHTLNKPSPNELGMRTNEENDARYARLAVTNSFQAKQSVVANGEQLTLKTPAGASEAYSAIVGRNANNDKTWAVGNLTRGSLDVHLENSRGSRITLGAIVSVNKALAITGQVQPSDFSNLDARYFTQTAANQRFAQLVGNNTFRGINNFVGEFNITRDNAVLVVKNATAATGLYLLGQKADGTNKFYLGTDDSDSVVNLHNYTTSTTISLSNVITTTKTVKITGQVQPSDWTNIDSRYISAGTLSNLAKLSDVNTFRIAQIINQNGSLLQLKNTTQDRELYFAGHNADGVRRWYIGNGEPSNPERFVIHNDRTATTIYMKDDFLLNKTVKITGQVQPSDWSNLDARYFLKTKLLNQSLMVRTTNRLEDTASFNKDYSGFVRNNDIEQGLKDLAIHVAHSAGIAHARGIAFTYGSKGLDVFTYAYGSDGEYVGEAQLYSTAFKPTPSDIGAYTKTETDQKIAQAVSDSTDLNKIYPVGIVTWFNSNVNPNTALPGLTWTYLNNGVGRTIRIAAANGSDVATTGGSDSVTLAVGNLPSHTHSFSATTSSFDYGTKNTNTTGAHAHSVSGSTSSAGNHNHSISWIGQNSTHYSGGGGGSIGVGPGYTDANGAHTHSVSGTAASAGNHAHSVGIGAHSHTVSGNTGGTGSGSAFSVTNQFYKLMAWVRTA
ncbi:tail fibers protein [Escherichia phage skuden]|uniref:Tail fibers protein n=1 Tax=Escherichia phage skuden TaxID=2696443 RepID=A0A6B9WPE2_9CAUD|nr:tail fibers protein [Escherichia phage skuden]